MITDDDEEGFQSAFASEQRLLAQRQQLLMPEPAAVKGPETFDTHTIDNRLAEMQINTDLIEEAKQVSQQKKTGSSINQSRQLDEARQIRISDQMLFGSDGGDIKHSSASSTQMQKQAVINEFLGS